MVIVRPSSFCQHEPSIKADILSCMMTQLNRWTAWQMMDLTDDERFNQPKDLALAQACYDNGSDSEDDE